MKYSKYLLIPFTFACIHFAHAETLSSERLLDLPFNNEALFTKKHSGIFFYYDLNETPTKKIICKLSKVHKGQLIFRNQGKHEASSIDDNEISVTLTLTSKGPKIGNQYHIDTYGRVKINGINSKKGKNAFATCHYEEDA